MILSPVQFLHNAIKSMESDDANLFTLWLNVRAFLPRFGESKIVADAWLKYYLKHVYQHPLVEQSMYLIPSSDFEPDMLTLSKWYGDTYTFEFVAPKTKYLWEYFNIEYNENYLVAYFVCKAITQKALLNFKDCFSSLRYDLYKITGDQSPMIFNLVFKLSKIIINETSVERSLEDQLYCRSSWVQNSMRSC